MSSSTSWLNEMKAAAEQAVSLMDQINKVYNVAQRNARAYNDRLPPAEQVVGTEDIFRNWLVQTGAAGTFPAPTDEDIWQAAIVLNNLRASMSEDDFQILEWISI